MDKVNQLVPPGEDAVFELVHGLMHQFRSLQYRVLREGPHAITHMESRALGFFARHPGATQSDLATHSGRDKAQLARLVKGLRDAGLLAAEADALDRRNVRLTLTPDGQAVQRTLRQQGRALGRRAIAGLSDAEHAQLVLLLQRVKANLDAVG